MASIPPKGLPGQIAGPLAMGLNTLDEQQEINFVLYNRRVLTLDGSVFWVNSAVTNEGGIPTSFNARGSLHHTTQNTQDPDESMSIHRIVFTSLSEVDQLSAVAPGTIWMGETGGERFAFSTRSSWYKQAALYHYSGDAVYPPLATQIVDTEEDLNLVDVVVSNSLPIWLRFNNLPSPLAPPPFPLYPSMLIPDNMVPPYASVHIDAEDTTPMTAGATHDSTGTRWQLARDRVRIVTFGVRNDDIMDFLDLVQAYALNNPSIMGIMNTPVPGDGKRGQVEISSLAQKKVIEFHVNYYQKRARDIARQLITEALISDFLVGDP